MTTYDMHGVALRVDAPADLAQVIDARLSAFRCPDHAVGATVRMTWRRVRGTGGSELVRPPGRGRPVYGDGGAEVRWWDDVPALWLEHPAVRALCLPAAGVVQVELLSEGGEARWLATHGVATLSLIEVLRHRGLHNLHAGAVGTERGALLLPGPTGSGKTTLSLALARSGLQLLGDDTVLLRQAGDRVAVHAFPDEVDVTRHTVDMLPWLADHTVAQRPPGWPKWSLHPLMLFSTKPALVTAPLALAFPKVSGEQRTFVEPIDAGTALAEMLPSALLTDPHVVQAHVDVLGLLARSLPAYRVHTGLDLAAAAAVVKDAVGLQ